MEKGEGVSDRIGSVMRHVEAASRLQAQKQTEDAAHQLEQALAVAPREWVAPVLDALVALYIELRDVVRLSCLYERAFLPSPYSPTVLQGALLLCRAERLGFIARVPAKCHPGVLMPIFRSHLAAGKYQIQDLVLAAGVFTQIGERAMAVEVLNLLAGSLWTDWALEHLVALSLAEGENPLDLEKHFRQLAEALGAGGNSDAHARLVRALRRMAGRLNALHAIAQPGAALGDGDVEAKIGNFLEFRVVGDKPTRKEGHGRVEDGDGVVSASGGSGDRARRG
ncbi:MAG: hypothetical protein M0037_00755 [Betaproteobacteria bacterium]|nr:hypothetical protein [Betaproteobacteria bacterium]